MTPQTATKVCDLFSTLKKTRIHTKLERYLYLELKVIKKCSLMQSIPCLGLKWLLVFVHVTQPSMVVVDWHNIVSVAEMLSCLPYKEPRPVEVITPIISPSSWQVLRSWDWNHVFRENLEMFSFHIGSHCSLYTVLHQGCQILERGKNYKTGLSNQILTQTYNIRRSPWKRRSNFSGQHLTWRA